jgi:hypothetical protein
MREIGRVLVAAEVRSLAGRTICKKLVIFDNRFNTTALKSELLNFAKNWDSLKKTLPAFYLENKNTNITFENDGSSDEIEECDTQNAIKTSCRFCMNCTICCLHVLVKYNMYSSAYSNLGLAYKYLLTLPSTQVPIYIFYKLFK